MTQRIGPKGQIVIPKAIRDRFGLRPGDEVVVTFDERGALIQPAARNVSLKGRLSGYGLVEQLEADHRAEPQ